VSNLYFEGRKERSTLARFGRSREKGKAQRCQACFTCFADKWSRFCSPLEKLENKDRLVLRNVTRPNQEQAIIYRALNFKQTSSNIRKKAVVLH